MSYTEGVFLLLGTNLGDKISNLQSAVELLQQADVDIIKSSSVYTSEPWGVQEQPSFLNAVLEVTPKQTVYDLLPLCLKVEKKMGRKRIIKWGERIIDIDILYHGKQVINTRNLTVPHPGIPDRRFTLIPLAELSPQFIHPVIMKNQTELLNACADPLLCHKTEYSLDL